MKMTIKNEDDLKNELTTYYYLLAIIITHTLNITFMNITKYSEKKFSQINNILDFLVSFNIKSEI